MSRIRFPFRDLLIAVAAFATAFYCRPGQVNPRTILPGTSRLAVYWLCGPPSSYTGDELWRYAHRQQNILFDDGRVKSIIADDDPALPWEELTATRGKHQSVFFPSLRNTSQIRDFQDSRGFSTNVGAPDAVR